MDKGPCFKCEERHDFCQDHCPKGIAWVAEKHKRDEAVKAKQKLDHDLDLILNKKHRGTWR